MTYPSIEKLEAQITGFEKWTSQRLEEMKKHVEELKKKENPHRLEFKTRPDGDIVLEIGGRYAGSLYREHGIVHLDKDVFEPYESTGFFGFKLKESLTK